MRMLRCLVLVLAAVFLAAFNESAAGHTAEANTHPQPPHTNAPPAKWHSVTIEPSPKTPQIDSCDRASLAWWFGNADEPEPPAWFKPDDKGRYRKWYWRNPLHNFSHYVIGLADKTYVRSGRYPDKISNPNGGWNFAIAKYGWWRLPYLSYRRGKFEFYFGWRVRGNFGVKFNWNPEHTHPLPAKG